ncbi:hypothetical protein F5X68DRAFT_186779 [Plectosphaerella plurivora]|uniref:Uncharacterized protein n=1 Tax=Plectosphaerella plurivora TaxID=936078 RepID=A0A9P8VKP2_9PEZI|nr:hypothetical protein F5X68DRAFT_186779 [Plectosphaerella plurivora]
MAEEQAMYLVKNGWNTGEFPFLDAMLRIARRRDGSWAISPELVMLMVNVLNGRQDQVYNVVDFDLLSIALGLLERYGHLKLAAPFMPQWLVSLGYGDSNLVARSWRGVHVAWLTADACRLPLCVEVMAHACRVTKDGEIIDAEGMTYASSPFELPSWLPRDIANLRARNLNNILWLTGKYIRNTHFAATSDIFRRRELFRQRSAKIKQDLETAGKTASVEELLDSIITAHPHRKDQARLRPFIEPTNESTRISFTAAFSQEEEDPSGTLLMSRFDENVVDSIRQQRDAVHLPERYETKAPEGFRPEEKKILAKEENFRHFGTRSGVGVMNGGVGMISSDMDWTVDGLSPLILGLGETVDNGSLGIPLMALLGKW